MSGRHRLAVQSSKMSGRYPMTESGESLDEAVRQLRKELRALREVGLWPAIEKGRLPQLAKLARQAVAKSDPTVAERMTRGSPNDRRRATAEAIRAFIIDTVADPLTGLPEQANAALPDLFALDAPSAEVTPERKQRLEHAVANANYQPSYFDKLAQDWLDRLSERMHKRSREGTVPSPEQKLELPASVPTTYVESPEDAASISDAHANGDGLAAPGPANTAPPTTTDREPVSLDPTMREASRATFDTDPTSPSDEFPDSATPTLPKSAPPSWGQHRRLTLALALCACGAIAALIVILTTARGGAGSGACGPTTAHLFTPPEKFGEEAEVSSTLYIYAPNQAGAQHGWTNTFYPYSHPEEVFHAQETRLLALTNPYPGEGNLTARIGLPSRAALVPNSTCVYRYDKYATGTRYTGTPLQNGLKIDNLRPRESIYVTFRVRLPSDNQKSATFYGAIGPAEDSTLPEDSLLAPTWIAHASSLSLSLTH
jgi:hypothetical protein